MRIYSVSNLKLSYADKSFWHASPMDFVRLIAGADYVVSNSFHATAFSLIYRKDFCVAARTDHSNSRMLSLLKDFGLESRYAGSFSKELCTKTDYSAVLPVLTAKTETSKQFLKDNIK